MEELAISRVLDGKCQGSSRPVLVDTSCGLHFVKLRGAAQGSGALVSEIIVAELAEALHLPVLPRRLALLEPDTPIDDKNDELADLLTASMGLNLAFPLINNARDATKNDLLRFTSGERAAILWLDRFVMNPDRTNRNPNVLHSDGQLYLIDHGASLRFQYNWSKVTEEMPSDVCHSWKSHIFETISETNEWAYWDDLFAQCITRSLLERAVETVPDSFIFPMLPKNIIDDTPEILERAIQRRKAAYVAFLWKRLKPPRDFALKSSTFHKTNYSEINDRGLTNVST